jgi:AcrR family transcriptional regulator
MAMTTPKLNRHELKTRQTRELLLRAAEKIFVRDGYAGSELGEIAKLAGRTKGAIYAQFKSKEDIFLALVEEHAIRYRAQMREAIEASTSIEQNLEALRKFYFKLSEDQAFNILMLEFKLFAMRHPEAKKRFQRFFAKLVSSDREKHFAELLGQAGKEKGDIGRSQAVQVMQALLSGLCLESRFDSGLGEDVQRKVVARIFDALLNVSSPK